MPHPPPPLEAKPGLIQRLVEKIIEPDQGIGPERHPIAYLVAGRDPADRRGRGDVDLAFRKADPTLPFIFEEEDREQRRIGSVCFCARGNVLGL
jgi:hypothetical protein